MAASQSSMSSNYYPDPIVNSSSTGDDNSDKDANVYQPFWRRWGWVRTMISSWVHEEGTPYHETLYDSGKQEALEAFVNGLRDDYDNLYARVELIRQWNENQGNSSHQKKQDTTKFENASAKKNYNGKKPYCNRCYKHHYEACTIVCDRCKKVGHMSKDCKVNLAQPTGNKPKTCYGCGQVGHMKNQCPNAKKDGNAKGRAFNISEKGARENPDLVTDTKYIIELANGKTLKVDKIFQGCALMLADKLFEVDLMPVELGSFDVIIGMDWLSKNHANIACAEKAIRIPLANGETLVVQGEKSGAKLNIISCMKAHKCIRKGCQAILSHVKEIESEKKQLEDVPVVKDFPGVFPEDLPGLPPHRQVEFQIDLIPGAAPVARPPYRLAPSELQELSNQLQELLDKGFIRPSSSPWGAPILFIQDFSKIARPLTTLTHKGKKFEWLKEQESAFQQLKHKLTTAPILSLPEGNEDFVVYCDASRQGLGCVLMQRQKVIAYASRQLKVHEQSYTTHDLELGAIVFALKMWRHYLFGTKCTIFTDHKSLQHIFDQKQLNMRQQRWVELLNDYDCEIRYHPGKANLVADALSRKEKIKPLRVRALNITIRANLVSQIRDAQLEAVKEEHWKDEAIKGLIKQIEVKGDGTRYFAGRLWVPKYGELRKLVLDEAHKTRYSIHPGTGKMYHDIKEFYWWPNMKADVATYVSQCMTCAKVKVENQKPSGSPLCWSQVGDRQLTGPEIIHETTEKIFQIQERLKTAMSRQKSYADVRRKSLEFQVGDKVMLKVSPWKGVIRFGKRGKLSPRYVGPFEIIERIGPVAYRLKLPQELSGIHDAFHILNLKKCLSDYTLVIPLEEIRIDNKLHFIEEPAKIMDREVKRLKHSSIPIVKGLYNPGLTFKS
ncbi:uncharacterized protein [Rutidosis leptorrhynchoides]|uniref:uncharacterized protein n=1 Tax=Rutidosis leptorrhynchoides TaxID=125765 RepID=UPI003A9A4D61